jgi:phosphoribosylaminoimidazole-succinocarboxamide synthase
MPIIPPSVDTEGIPGLQRYHQGKVRDTYLLPGYPKLLLSVPSNRISIFDIVLPALVEQKGEVLTAMNIFWRTQIFQPLIPHDLFAYGAHIDAYLPPHLCGSAVLQKRAVVVKKLEMLPVEAIVRGYLTGSGFAAYQKHQPVCDHLLPDGLRDGSELPYAIFTPTTKAQEGHDVHLSVNDVAQKYGFLPERFSLQLYQLAQSFARTCGIIIADTKFEFGLDAKGRLTLGDEMLTPDSSRFWDQKVWKDMRVKMTSPPPLDKQFVRDEGIKLGMKSSADLTQAEIARVHQLNISPEVLRRTTKLYRYIFSRLAGRRLETFQRHVMGIESSSLHVEIVLGSTSDLPQTFLGRKFLDSMSGEVRVRLNIISCHRNPEELRNYVKELPRNCIVIAAAGKAAALPGMLCSWLQHFGKGDVPVLGVGLAGDTKNANMAAQLSIQELPGRSVIVTDHGLPYFGKQGFLDACKAAVEQEFLTTPSSPKKAEYNLPLLPEK